MDIVVKYDSFLPSFFFLICHGGNISGSCYFAIILHRTGEEIKFVSFNFHQNMSFPTSLNSPSNLPPRSPSRPSLSPSKTSSYLHTDPLPVTFCGFPHCAPIILYTHLSYSLHHTVLYLVICTVSPLSVTSPIHLDLPGVGLSRMTGR